MGDGLFVHGGVTSALEARLALAGLLAVQGSSLLDVRTGVMHGPGSTALVTGTSATAPMQVAIAVHDGVSSRGVANGPYLMPTEAVQLVNIGAAPGSGTRIDIVYEKQGDATPGVPTPDGTTGPVYGVKQGTVGAGKPDLSTIVGAEELATVAVSAGATRTTDGTVLITNTARQTVAHGADIPVRNQAERDLLTKFAGLTVYRMDTGDTEMVNLAETGWVTTYRTPAGWATLPLASGWGVYTESGIYPASIGYRREADRVFLRGYLQATSAVAAGAAISTSGAIPASLRAATNTPMFAPVELAVPVRLALTTNGTLITYRAVASGTFINLDGVSWPIG